MLALPWRELLLALPVANVCGHGWEETADRRVQAHPAIYWWPCEFMRQITFVWFDSWLQEFCVYSGWVSDKCFECRLGWCSKLLSRLWKRCKSFMHRNVHKCMHALYCVVLKLFLVFSHSDPIGMLHVIWLTNWLFWKLHSYLDIAWHWQSWCFSSENSTRGSNHTNTVSNISGHSSKWKVWRMMLILAMSCSGSNTAYLQYPSSIYSVLHWTVCKELFCIKGLLSQLIVVVHRFIRKETASLHLLYIYLCISTYTVLYFSKVCLFIRDSRQKYTNKQPPKSQRCGDPPGKTTLRVSGTHPVVLTACSVYVLPVFALQLTAILLLLSILVSGCMVHQPMLQTINQ